MDARALDILKKHGFRAFALYCYLLALGAGRGEVRTSEWRIRTDCGMRPDTVRQLLAGLEAAGAVSVRRDSGQLSITVTTLPSAPPETVTALPSAPPETVTALPSAPPETVTALPVEAARVYTHMRGGGRDQGLIHVNKESTKNKFFVKEKVAQNPPLPGASFQPPPRAEPAAFRYPETPEEVRAAAEAQGLAMTLEQARDFLEYHLSFGWTIRESRIPPNAWRWRLRRWMENLRRRQPERPGDRASPGLDAGEGFDRIGF